MNVFTKRHKNVAIDILRRLAEDYHITWDQNVSLVEAVVSTICNRTVRIIHTACFSNMTIRLHKEISPKQLFQIMTKIVINLKCVLDHQRYTTFRNYPEKAVEDKKLIIM